MAEAPQLQSSRRSAGETLKYHREARNLSVTDIAAQMRLDPAIIRALESDDYERLPAALYVRGYLRGYAKILKLDPAGLLQLYDSAVPQSVPEIIPEVKHPTQRRSGDRPVKVVTYLVTFIFFLLVAAWWQSKFVVVNRAASDPAAAQADELPPPRLAYPITVIEHPDSPFYRAPPPEEETPAPAQPAAVDPTVAPQPAADLQVPPSGPDRLRLQLSADSWVEVVDARGAKIFTGLVRAGDSLDLRVQAPLDVLLGYAPGVSVDFNGNAFDPAPYSRSGVARFTLANEVVAGSDR